MTHVYHKMALPKFHFKKSLGSIFGIRNYMLSTDKKKTMPRLKIIRSIYHSPVWFSISNGLKINIKMLALNPINKSHKIFFRELLGLGNGVYKILGNFIGHQYNRKRLDIYLKL